MGARFYDEALIAKIRSWVGDQRLSVISSSDVSQLFATTADQQNDNGVELPLIAITRSGFSISNTNRTDFSINGLTLEVNRQRSEWLNAIPINLRYQIDVYSRYMEQADEIIRNMIFNIVNFPRLTISLPYYDQDIKQTSSIHLDEQVQDNSTIPERLIYGQFTRLTLNIDILDAYLYDLRIGDNKKIDTNVYLEEENTN